MKTATIVPTHFLDMIKDRPYQMALAHLVSTDAEYTKAYLNMSQEGAYVIMDNGVIEGDQQPIEEIIRRARCIKASEIILPDVFLDCEATLESTRRALDIARELVPDLKLMAVPQGKNLEEWLECAGIMLEWDIDCIGIPKILTKLEGRDARLHALMELHERYGKLLRTVDLHLLGCWENPIECTMIEKAAADGLIPEVRGVDSAIAYVYAREDMLITQGPRPTGAIDFSAKDANREKLAANIAIWESSVDISNGKVKRVHF